MSDKPVRSGSGAGGHFHPYRDTTRTANAHWASASAGQNQRQNHTQANIQPTQSNNQRHSHHHQQQQHQHQPQQQQNKWRIFSSVDSELNLSYFVNSKSGFPNFHQPKEIGVLLSEKRSAQLELKRAGNPELSEQLEKTKGCPLLVMPKDASNIHFDLKLGLDEFVPHIPHQHGIDSLLRWIMANKLRLLMPPSPPPPASPSADSKLFKADFICWRGLLTRIMVTPYEREADWKFSIVLYKRTYYLCELETDRQRHERLHMDERMRSFTYWGHKFESYLTVDFAGEEPNGAAEVPDQENNFSTFVCSRLNQHSLVYAAEVDCCLQSEPSALSDYCELKTSRGSSIRDLNFERQNKFLKWWLQSYLVDIQQIKVGLRNDIGIVSKLVDCPTNNIYKANSVRSKAPVCFNLLTAVFDLIREFCTDVDCVYVASYTAGANQIRIQRSSSKEGYFLPGWFTGAV